MGRVALRTGTGTGPGPTGPALSGPTAAGDGGSAAAHPGERGGERPQRSVADRRLARLGLRARATVAAALLALGATALLSLISYSLARTHLLAQRDTYTARQAYANARVVRDVLSSPNPDIAALLGSLRSDAGSFALVRLRGEWFGSNLGAAVEDLPASLQAAIDGGATARQRFSLHGSPHSAVAVTLPTVDGVYVEVFPLDALRRNLDVLALSLLVGSAVTVAGAAALGHRASREVLSPVVRVADAAEALARGGLDTRLPPERDPDLQRLVRSFNEMADTIQARIEREARFASDVSHELRTPLAALAAASEVLERRRDELSDPGRQALDIMARQIDRFTAMVLDLLEISRIDAGMADVHLQPVAVGALIRKIVAGGPYPSVTVDIDDVAASAVAPIDVRRFERMLVNLLDNATRYGAERVVVRMETGGPDLRVHVDDDGPGVAPAERPAVFDRFTRGTTAGTTAGTGLGLALVHEHVKLHRGSVELTDAPEGGARFTLRLPKRRA